MCDKRTLHRQQPYIQCSGDLFKAGHWTSFEETKHGLSGLHLLHNAAHGGITRIKPTCMLFTHKLLLCHIAHACLQIPYLFIPFLAGFKRLAGTGKV